MQDIHNDPKYTNDDTSILQRVYRYTHPYSKQLYITLFLTILLAIIAPTRPMLVQYTFDNIILSFNTKGLIIMTILMILLIILQTIIQYYHTYLSHWIGQTVIKNLRVEVYAHIIRLRLKYFDKSTVGTLVTRTVSDIETIEEVFSEGLIIIIADLLQLTIIISVMFYTNWRLTLISLSILPLLLLATYIFKVKVKAAFQDVRTQVAKLNAFLNEHITGMNVVQVFNRERMEMNKFQEINAQHKDAHIRTIWYYSLFFPVVEILSAASIGLMIWWGAKDMVNNLASLGSLIAFLLYINMLFRPIRELADKFNTLQLGMVSSERVFRVLDTNEFIDNKGKITNQHINGHIKFENVWFAYTDNEYVLKNISFEIGQGKTLAIVGRTGSGKTSLINVLYRFYDLNKGIIKLDETDIKDYELNYLRNNLALVPQDVFLFSDTIFNNITLRDAKISRSQIIEATRMLEIEPFIMQFPGNYDFNVKERGTLLSTGQKQLISFIRALVFNPGILLLDEATSSIDTETERLIQKTIPKLIQNRTSIVIAHRLSTIQNADKIIVLDHGEIKEMGSHLELLNNNGYYKKLYDIQFQT